MDKFDKKMLHKYVKAIGNVQTTITNSKPFYSEQVYKYADKLLSKSYYKIL